MEKAKNKYKHLARIALIAEHGYGKYVLPWVGTLTSGLVHLPSLPLALHGRLLLQVAVVRDIRDLLCVLLDAQRFGIVGHLRQLALGLLKVRVVLHIRLDLGVLRDPLQLRRVRNGGRLGLRDVPVNWWGPFDGLLNNCDDDNNNKCMFMRYKQQMGHYVADVCV